MKNIPEYPKLKLKNYLDLLIDKNVDRITGCPICLDGCKDIVAEIFADLKANYGKGLHKLLKREVGTTFYAWRSGKWPIPIWKMKKLIDIWAKICRKSDRERNKLYANVFHGAKKFKLFKSPLRIIVIKNLTPKLAYLIGNIYADGALRNSIEVKKRKGRYNYEITITDESKEHLQDIVELLEELFNIKTNVKTAYNGKWYRILFSSSTIHRFLNKVFEMPLGYKKGKLRVPKVIKNAPLEIQKYFIIGFFDGDGSCTNLEDGRKKFTPVVHAGQSDKKILIDIQEMLKKFELNFNLHKHRYKQYEWYSLNTKDKKQIKQFQKKIGFTHPLKKERLQILVKKLI